MLFVITVIDVIEDRGAVGFARTQSAVIEIKRPVITDQAQHVAVDERKITAVIDILDEKALGEPDRCSTPVYDPVNLLEKVVALLATDVLVDSTGDCGSAVHTLAGRNTNHFLTILAQQHTLFCDIGIVSQYADDISMTHLVVVAEQQVGRRQMKKMQRMGLQHLPAMHEPANLLGGRRQLVHTDQLVCSLRSREMVAHRTDTTETLYHNRKLPVGTSLDEFFETAEFHDVETRLVHAVLLIHQQGHLAVTLDACHRIDRDTTQFFRVPGSFERISHGRTQS